MTGKTILAAAAGLVAVALLAFAAGPRVYAGILTVTLDPATATNEVGTDHTVTATVSGVGPGQLVTFAVTSGPNTGATFTCSPNADCTTDANEEVSGTYTGDGGVGQDTIEACAQIPTAQQLPCDTATKDWVQATPTPTPSATPSATPTPTQAAPAAELPSTGTGPAAGPDVPWFLVGVAGLGALALGGGMLLRRRAR